MLVSSVASSAIFVTCTSFDCILASIELNLCCQFWTAADMLATAEQIDTVRLKFYDSAAKAVALFSDAYSTSLSCWWNRFLRICLFRKDHYIHRQINAISSQSYDYRCVIIHICGNTLLSTISNGSSRVLLTSSCCNSNYAQYKIQDNIIDIQMEAPCDLHNQKKLFGRKPDLLAVSKFSSLPYPTVRHLCCRRLSTAVLAA